MLEPDPVELAVGRLLESRLAGGPKEVEQLVPLLRSLPARRLVQGALRLIAVDLESVLPDSGGLVPRDRYRPLESILHPAGGVETIVGQAARGPLLDHAPGPGDFLPRWADSRESVLRLVSVLGRGGFATVFEAEDLRNDGAVVAAKGPWVEGVPTEEAVELLEREGEILAALDHPHVISLHRVARDAGHLPVLVLEKLQRADLTGLAGKLSADQVVQHLIDLASALEHLRRNQVVHRDVTLGNVGLGFDGRPRLFDFGLAVRMGERGRHEFERAGTLSSMALQQQFGISREIDCRIDVAGLGVLGLQLLSPRGFQVGNTTEENVVNWMLEIPAMAVDDLESPEPLLRVLRRAVARDAAARHPTPGDLHRELTQAAEEMDR